MYRVCRFCYRFPAVRGQAKRRPVRSHTSEASPGPHTLCVRALLRRRGLDWRGRGGFCRLGRWGVDGFGLERRRLGWRRQWLTCSRRRGRLCGGLGFGCRLCRRGCQFGRRRSGRCCIRHAQISLGLLDDMRGFFHFRGQEVFHQTEKTLIKLRRRNRFTGHLDHRVIGRAYRHRDRAQHTHPEACRVVGLLQCVTVLQGVGEHGGAAIFHVGRAHQIEADLDMGITGLLKTLAAGDHFRIVAGDDVALTQQSTPPRLAIRQISRRITARERPGVIEVLMVVNRLFGR
ncbi:Translation initiation factor IF-2 [Pseudomonas syringae pv. actinidiae]|uniref:Translation initiation factor IF-2 n=1 Tax=Pseudomonas syringae pv. actinidiae TaxID=103796 RepID=A0AAN4QBK9_PSESF|nr:Translation initiation factor IF-2 [Pseudomonas syringae pv. actinidiae]